MTLEKVRVFKTVREKSMCHMLKSSINLVIDFLVETLRPETEMIYIK